MEFHIRAHAVDLDDVTRDYAEEKIGRGVTKLLRGNARVDVEVTEVAQLTRVKIHVAIPHAPSETVHADEADARAAIDVAAGKLFRSLRRHKERRRDKARHAGGQVTLDDFEENDGLDTMESPPA